MSRTGILFHYQDGTRLQDFPEALSGILARDNVLLFDAYYPFKKASEYDLEPLPVDALCRVHSREMVERLRHLPDFEGALISASGTVSAGLRIMEGEIENAFVFTGYGDHHAGRDFFGGGCLINGAAIAIDQLRRRCGVERFAIVDTDAHHGDGTWDIFAGDPQVLYLCLCSGVDREEENNVNVRVPFPVTDEMYLDLVREHLHPRMEHHQPEIVLWNWGYDGTRGDYGDMGLTPGVHPRLAAEIKAIAERFCHGRLAVVLCGGSRRDLARSIIPRIIEVLSS